MIFNNYGPYNNEAYQNKKESVKSYQSPGYNVPQTYSNSGFDIAKRATFNAAASNKYYEDWKKSLNEKKPKRSGLDRIFDLLQVGQYAVVGQLRSSFSPKESRIGNFGKALRSANPFGDDYTEGEFSVGETLSDIGWNPKSKVGKVARFAVGFVGDVALDPLTYVSGGSSAVLKGSGKVAGKAASKAAPIITKEAAESILRKAGREVTTEATEAMIKKVNKYAGIPDNLTDDIVYGFGKNKKKLADAETLRMLGDKTIAPYVNSMSDFLIKHQVFKGIDKNVALKKLARENPTEVAKALEAHALMSKHSEKLGKMDAAIKRKVSGLTKHLTEDEQDKVFRLLEDTDIWRQSVETPGLVNTIKGRELIKKYETELAIANKKLDYFANLSRKHSEAVRGLNNIDDVTAKLQASKANAEVAKLTDYRNTLVSTRDEVKRGLLTASMNADNVIAPKVVIENRGYFKAPTGNQSLPYGFRKAGDFIRSTDNKFTVDLETYLNKPLNELSKVNGRRPYATSAESVNKFLSKSNLGQADYQAKLVDLIEKSPILRTEFKMGGLAPNISPDTAKKFLKMYADEPAGKFIDNIRELKRGFKEADSIAKAEGLTGAKWYKRVDDLLLDESKRLDEFSKLVDSGKLTATKSKIKEAITRGARGIDDIKKDLNLLKDKMATGSVNDVDINALEELTSELTNARKRLVNNGALNNDVERFRSGLELSGKEIDDILATDYGRNIESALDDSYFDPWDDIENVSQRAQESTEMFDKFVHGSDVVKLFDTESVSLADDIAKSKDEVLREIFETSTEDNAKNAAEAMKRKRFAEAVKKSTDGFAKKESLTAKQVKNLDKYLKLDYDTIVKKLDNIDKVAGDSYKRGLLKKYFPDKRLRDLTSLEKNLINTKMDDALKVGTIENVNRQQFFEELLERSEILIKDLDPRIEEIYKNSQMTQEGYWMHSKQLQKTATELADKLADPKLINDTKEASKISQELTRVFKENRVDDYARSQLGSDFNKYVNYKKLPKSELFNADGLDAATKKTLTDIREFLDELSVMEKSKRVTAYAPHIVKEKYKKYAYNFENLAQDAITGSDGRPFIGSKLKRKFEGSVADWQKLWDEGKLAKKFPGTDIEVPRDLFETQITKVLTERALKHNNYMFEKKNYEKVLGLVSEKASRKLKPGEIHVVTRDELLNFGKALFKDTDEVVTASGLTDILKNSGIDIELTPDTNFAKINKGADELFNTTIDGKPYFNPRIMKDDIASHFNQLTKYQKSEEISKVLDLYDKALHVWKLNATVTNPAFHTRNLAGDAFNSYLDIGTKSFSIKDKLRVRDILSGKNVDDIITKTGKVYKADEIVEIAKRFEVIDSGFFSSDIGGNINSNLKNSSKWAKFNPLDPDAFIPYKKGTEVGTAFENMDRMQNFLHHIEDGLDVHEAVSRTQHFMFDYKSATAFEKEVIRRVIPFWTWSKKNIPLQIEQVIKHPEKYRVFAKGLRGLDESNEGDKDSTLSKDKFGDFAKDWVRLPSEQGGGAKIFNPNLPYQDLSFSVKDIVGRLSPFIKVPAEVATGQNFFYDKPIDSNIKHILTQLGPLGNAEKLIRKEGDDRVLELIAQLTGFKMLSYDQSKYNYNRIINETDKSKSSGGK